MRSITLLATLALMGCGSEPPPDRGAVAADSAPAVTAPNVMSVEEPATFGVGSTAPNFELAGSDGKTHRLTDYAGEHVVLAFFPKAFTGG